MAWQERDRMSLKLEFIQDYLSKRYDVSELCLRYGISRPTGYKWIQRFQELGLEGLADYSRRPHSCPNRITSDSVSTILDARTKFPAWGARKLRQYLVNQGQDNLPCESTFNRVLQRYGKIEEIESFNRRHFVRFEKEKPNELWQMDFKGHFRVAEGRCHPLTVLDDHSRFAICLKASPAETFSFVKQSLEEVFQKYGLPDQMTMDNGSPWKGSPPWTLSKLTIWLMRLGIIVSHSAPRHPQTQGKDERFHRSLKDEVLRYYQFSSMDHAQQVFDEWRSIYNDIRPHEGIGMKCPSQRYKPSQKPFPSVLPPIEYQDNDILRKVQACGCINYKDQRFFLGEHLMGEYVALRPWQNEGTFDVYYCRTKIKRITPK